VAAVAAAAVFQMPQLVVVVVGKEFLLLVYIQ
jgi:hypothetical protein